MALPLVHIWSDGACSPNPGFGGWGVVLIAPEHGNHRTELSGSELNTTNNRMELTGAIRALEHLKKPSHVVLHTDSTYVKNAFTNHWLEKWQKNGWRTSNKTAVINEDLWREMLRLAEIHEIEWVWVPGHADNVENNRCDELAVAARVELAARTRGR